MSREENFMEMAISLAEKGMQENEGGPFGCIIVKDNRIIGSGNNKVTSTNDPTAHAEIIAIREACKFLQSYQLQDCEIYTSCEPCPMCLGAIYWARPRVVYYGNTREDAASAGFDDSMIYEEMKRETGKRKIPAINLGRQKAWRNFEEWGRKINKITY